MLTVLLLLTRLTFIAVVQLVIIAIYSGEFIFIHEMSIEAKVGFTFAMLIIFVIWTICTYTPNKKIVS